jgi:hypothetical protein
MLGAPTIPVHPAARTPIAARSGVGATVLRGSVAGAAALVLAHLTVVGRPATLCPLRALTGVPCPLCGGTTAAVHIGRLDVAGALRASPFVVGCALLVVLTPVLLAIHRASGRAAFTQRARYRLLLLALVGVVFSEIWQLVRFGIV